MVKKAIVALACVLIASSAFAQTTLERTRYHRTTTAITSVEGVTVTAPIIQAEEGSAASYQPAGTLVVEAALEVDPLAATAEECRDAGVHATIVAGDLVHDAR